MLLLNRPATMVPVLPFAKLRLSPALRSRLDANRRFPIRKPQAPALGISMRLALAAALLLFSSVMLATWPTRLTSAAFKSLHVVWDASLPVDSGKALRPTELEPPHMQPAMRDANIAYFFQISNHTVWHLPRLFKKAYHHNNVYAIHFDSKVPAKVVRHVKSELKKSSPSYEKNTHFMAPEQITYRGVSTVLNTLNAMTLLLEVDAKWDYFINLSGSDYPLVSAVIQRQTLGRYPPIYNFFSFAEKGKWTRALEQRMGHFHVDEALTSRKHASRVERVSARNPLIGLMDGQLAYSEAWQINSRAFCVHATSSPLSRKVILAVGYGLSSAEHFFSSLAWSSQRFNSTILPNSMRLIIWEHEGKRAGQHPFFLDERGGANTDGDFIFKGRLQKSPEFFARKFRSPNSALMDWIDSRAGDPKHKAMVEEHFDSQVRNRNYLNRIAAIESRQNVPEL